MKLASAILSSRRHILETMDHQGLWYEAQQGTEHHHIDKQIARSTALNVIPKPRHLGGPSASLVRSRDPSTAVQLTGGARAAFAASL